MLERDTCTLMGGCIVQKDKEKEGRHTQVLWVRGVMFDMVWVRRSSCV